MPDPIDVVIDILHHNGNVNLGKAAVAGIMGVIQKARQGQAGADPAYKTNPQSSRRGTAVGRLSVDSDGVRQAENFLSVVGDDPDTSLVLDFEPNPTGPSMTLDEARPSLPMCNR